MLKMQSRGLLEAGSLEAIAAQLQTGSTYSPYRPKPYSEPVKKVHIRLLAYNTLIVPIWDLSDSN